MASTGSPGVPGTAEAPLGTEGLVHNKAMEPPQNLDLPISHTGIGCKIGKTAAFWVADPTSPALLLVSCVSFPD